MRALIFQLYGPMASWGEAAVGEMRASHSTPSRSALVGLLCAGLGLKREQEVEILQLSQQLIFAVKQLSGGSLLRDYHTTQAPARNASKWALRTRKDELAVDPARISTILSTREYRSDGYWLVAVQLATDASPKVLDKLQAALSTPTFVPYLGRKSCPTALPIKPVIVSEKGLSAAFCAYQRDLDLPDGLTLDSHILYCWEGDAGDLTAEQTIRRNDNVLSRKRWQFGSRMESQLRVARED